MTRVPDYQCKTMSNANYMGLSVLIDYMLAPMDQKYSIINEEMQKFHNLDLGGIFELLVHVQGCNSCKEFYDADLKVQASLRLEKIEDEKNSKTRGEKVSDLAARTREAMEILR